MLNSQYCNHGVAVSTCVLSKKELGEEAFFSSNKKFFDVFGILGKAFTHTIQWSFLSKSESEKVSYLYLVRKKN